MNNTTTEAISQWFSIDVESSSRYPTTCRLLSFAAIGMQVDLGARTVTGPYPVTELYFKQTAEVPSDSVAIHGLTRAKLMALSGGRLLEDQEQEFSPFLYGKINVIGHNVNFDRRVITNNIIRAGLPFPVWGKAIDTCSMSKQYWPNDRILNHKLGTCFAKMCSEQGITEEAYKRVYSMMSKRRDGIVAHDAGWDAFAAAKLFSYLLSKGAEVTYANPLK